MEKTKSEEVAMIFRQLSPINQRYFLMMVHTADIAEKNARKVNRQQMDSERETQEF